MIKFTKKQKRYILERIESAKKIAIDCAVKYDGDRHDYRLYLLGALESVLSGLCDETLSLDSFREEV